MERELRPADWAGFPRDALLVAEELIPRDAIYTVVLGSDLSYTQQLGFAPLLHYWLLPRRWTEKLDEAEWVVTVGDASSKLRARLRNPVEVLDGYVVAELAR